MKLPYVYGSVLLDGADIPLLHLVQAPARAGADGDARAGRVGARGASGKPTLESIRWFSPTGEPDARLRVVPGAPLMRDVAVVSFASSSSPQSEKDEVEMLAPVIAEAIASAKRRAEAGHWLHRLGELRLPRRAPVLLRHGARRRRRVAAHLASPTSRWTARGRSTRRGSRLQHGDIDAALVYAFGRSSQGRSRRRPRRAARPVLLAPLGPTRALARRPAGARDDRRERCTERDMAAVVARGRGVAVDELLRAPHVTSPLRAHDCAPPADGVAVSARGRRAVAKLRADLRGSGASITASRRTPSASATSPARPPPSSRRRRPVRRCVAVDVAEIHAPFAHQEILLREALGLDDRRARQPFGRRARRRPFIVAGLHRIGEAAASRSSGRGALAPSPTPHRGRACSRTSSASLEAAA